jgi:dCTP deaminase
MSILADSEIRQLCTPPNFVVKTNVPSSSNNSGNLVHYLPSQIKSFSYLTEEEIKFKIRMSNSTNLGNETLGVVSYRHLFQEEIDQFKPMISPYVTGQVRTQLRNPTANELQEWEQARHSGYVPDHFVSDDIDVGLQIKEKIISYGQSSYGYDVRLADEFKIFTNINNALIDPLNMSNQCYVDHKGSYCIIPPNSYILGRTIETFDMPKDVTAICLGKSTYARCAAIINVTPIEAGFKGQVVIEISNASNLPLKVYAGMGIAQFLFLKGDITCDVSYADRGGKYQNQVGLQTALV